MLHSFFRRIALALPLALVGCAAVGCTGDDAGNAGDAGKDGGVIDPGHDSSLGGDGDDGGPSVTTTFRIAHVSPDLGAFDVCYRSATITAWIGPLFAPPSPPDAGGPPPTDASAPDGASFDGAPDTSPADATPEVSLADAAADASAADAAPPPNPGVPFATMSRYVTVAGSGTFDVALVAAGETSCAHPRALGHITLDPGKHATVVVMGLSRADAGADTALAITAFADDLTMVPIAARARFIHAAPGGGRAQTLGPVAIDAITGAGSVPLVAEVRPGLASMASTGTPKIDDLGYGGATPISGSAGLRIRSLGDAGTATFSTTAFDLQMIASSIHTGILFDDTDGSLAVLWCNDGGVGGPVTQCAVWTAR